MKNLCKPIPKTITSIPALNPATNTRNCDTLAGDHESIATLTEDYLTRLSFSVYENLGVMDYCSIQVSLVRLKFQRAERSLLI